MERPDRDFYEPRAEPDGLTVAAMVTAWLFAPLGIILSAADRGKAKRAGLHQSYLGGWALFLSILFTVAVILAVILIAVAAAHGNQVPCDLSNPNYPNC